MAHGKCAKLPEVTRGLANPLERRVISPLLGCIPSFEGETHLNGGEVPISFARFSFITYHLKIKPGTGTKLICDDFPSKTSICKGLPSATPLRIIARGYIYLKPPDISP